MREKGKLTYLGRAQTPTTVENITVGLQNAKYNLTCAIDLPDFAADEVYAASSAAGGLRMVAMGFMPRVTAKAAKEVAMSAGARVLEILSHEDKPGFKVQVLREINPDIILLAGGTDGGDQESILENTQVIVESKVNAVVIIAGNSAAQPKVEAILNNSNIKNVRVANVMPTIHELKVKPARQAIHEQFIRQITRAKGLGKLKENVTNGKVIPTPGAVLLGAELLAAGTHNAGGLGDLLVLDIGGATTDVHSLLPSLGELPDEEKGLVINNEKQVSYRTVEGNLGLRVSATGIVETAGPEAILQKVGLSGKENWQRLISYASFVEKNPEHISTSEEEKMFDEAMAITALEIALKRHAGYLAREYDPILGVTPGTPIGRDLRKVKLVIGVGGIFTHSSLEKSFRIIEKALSNPGISLLPHKPQIIIDKNYLMYAIGAMGEIYPNETFEFAKEYFSLQ
ncbi:glutamate mutase L [Zhaonella formicivorans]|uniref:glutamate mutase L n=1 Tax=Zhaonella formicivorans TaxID=2528593 RepID=UPI0010D6A899